MGRTLRRGARDGDCPSKVPVDACLFSIQFTTSSTIVALHELGMKSSKFPLSLPFGCSGPLSQTVQRCSSFCKASASLKIDVCGVTWVVSVRPNAFIKNKAQLPWRKCKRRLGRAFGTKFLVCISLKIRIWSLFGPEGMSNKGCLPSP